MHRNGARRPLLSHLRRFCLRRHSLFSPPPRAGRRRPPRSLETGNQRRKRLGDQAGGLLTLEHPLQKAHSSTSRITPPPESLWELLRPLSQLATSSPTNPGPTCAAEPSVCTTRASHLPSHAASHPSPARKGSASSTHTTAV